MKKVAIISGATRGLGRALTAAFASRSYQVLGLYRSDTEAAASLEAEAKEYGWIVGLMRADICQACPLFADHEWLRDADDIVLVNNVGPTFEPMPMHLLKWEQYEQVFRAAMAGTVNLSTALIPIMIKNKQGVNTIVNVASTAASQPPKGFAAYAAVKAGMLSFTRSVGVEYGSRGLRVFSVSPGFMETPTTAQWHPSLIDAILKTQGSSDLETVSKRIADLVEDRSLPAAGEDYLIEA